jgi:hypothetical protein
MSILCHLPIKSYIQQKIIFKYCSLVQYLNDLSGKVTSINIKNAVFRSVQYLKITDENPQFDYQLYRMIVVSKKNHSVVYFNFFFQTE